MTYNITDIIEQMQLERNIDPTKIYCIQTGSPIGSINLDELQLAIDTCGCDDIESIIDDLEIRTLISMRPSIAWNSLDSRSIHRLRLKAPKQLLSYLMNRCYEPRNSTGNLKISWPQRISNYRERIKMWQWINSMSLEQETLNQLLLVLLRLDADFNLNTIEWHKNFLSPFAITTPESAQSYIDGLWEWHERLDKKKASAERQAKMSAEFWANRGNTVMRDATTKLIIEVTPKSEATLLRQAKKKADDEIMILLRTVMDSDEPQPKRTAVAAKPKGLIPAGSFKFALTRKAS